MEYEIHDVESFVLHFPILQNMSWDMKNSKAAKNKNYDVFKMKYDQ